MGERYEIVFSRDFADDLRDIGRYVERVSGPPATSRRQLEKVRDMAKTPAPMPKRHPIIDDGFASQLGLRRASVGNYAIFYCVDDETSKVLIDRVIYGRRASRSYD